MNDSESDDLLEETWTRPLTFEPLTGFKEVPFAGRYVNVDAAGYRHIRIRRRGRPGRPARASLCSEGRPRLALACRTGRPFPRLCRRRSGALRRKLTCQLRPRVLLLHAGARLLRAIAGPRPRARDRDIHRWRQRVRDPRQRPGVFRPAGRDDGGREPSGPCRVRTWRPHAGTAAVPRGAGSRGKTPAGWDPQAADAPRAGDNERRTEPVIANYLANKRMIEGLSREFGVKPVFVWQPASSYAYDTRFHLFRDQLSARNALSGPGYRKMSRSLLDAARLQRPPMRSGPLTSRETRTKRCTWTPTTTRRP